ncbi:hypothetical protein BKH42_04655 [Helicobacter sp. 13S00482-2]|uniref:hypothetical protein n=1 Tax=Helicobacter sp. 13S00482-2 TaxID=1476200 RepID=UPI000BA53A8B|nr:hypothetical protein [Helicobacter sp. 13S00482-2]PAF53615.1 hypothetical protein BKH42_04655 [Helicobacter sp. 13S00482-2]
MAFKIIFFIFLVQNSKKTLQEYLTDMLSKEVVIKNLYINLEEFTKSIKTIASISFTSINNLFSKSLFDVKPDIFGLGEAESLKIKLKYCNRKITDIFPKKIINFFEKESDKLQSLICIGRDDNQMESIFNVSKFTQKISINIEKDASGRYKEDTVRKKFTRRNRFYMTSLSVLYGSKYAKSLYNEIDPKKQTQRKIHTLKAYFINSAHWALMCIVLSMLYLLFSKVNNAILNVIFKNILVTAIFINFLFIYLLLKIFMNRLLEENKDN